MTPVLPLPARGPRQLRPRRRRRGGGARPPRRGPAASETGPAPLPLAGPHAASRRRTPPRSSCIGQNYRKHAEEMGKPVPTEPLIFIKPSTALNAPGRAHPSCPRRARRSTTRPSWRSSSASGCTTRTRPGRAGHLGPHLLQRRHRARHPAAGNPAHPRQGLRHLRLRGPLDRDRPVARGPARRVPGERPGAPGRPHVRHGVQPPPGWSPSSPTS